MADPTAPDAVIGLRQSLRTIACGQAAKVYLASDASDKVVEPVLDACRRADVGQIDRSFTIAQLGKTAKIDVGAAVIVIKKT